jgi:hypothetical protein
MKVKLTYFKPDGGKYYSDAEYESMHPQIWNVWEEVRLMRRYGTLPGISGPSTFVVLIEAEGCEPRLVLS